MSTKLSHYSQNSHFQPNFKTYIFLLFRNFLQIYYSLSLINLLNNILLTNQTLASFLQNSRKINSDTHLSIIIKNMYSLTPNLDSTPHIQQHINFIEWLMQYSTPWKKIILHMCISGHNILGL